MMGAMVLSDRIRQLAARLAGRAALTGLAVFTGLYLAIGLGLFGGSLRPLALIWPYAVGSWFLRGSLLSLAAFAGVAFYVYRLKRRVEHWREVSRGVADHHENEIGRMYRHAEEAQANFREERERREQAEARAAAAEKRAADAEARGKNAGASAGAGEQARASEKRKSDKAKGGGGDDKIREVKRSFARLYHPDNIQGNGLDKMIRAEIFKEFWRELERIEKSSAT